MRKFIALIILVLPWIVRRQIYRLIFKYDIHTEAYIGFSWVYPDNLVLESGARIGHLSVCKNIASVEMGKDSIIGSLNWITGFPYGTDSLHFKSDINRFPALILKQHSAITGRHMIDCTDTITIGEFTTVAGIRSQLLTHSINLEKSRQEAMPIKIGKYCFIGTNTVILKGSEVPDYSVVGAMSLVNKKLDEEYLLYGGVPIKKIKSLSKEQLYFNRKIGYIN